MAIELDKEGATAILRKFDENFDKLEELIRWDNILSTSVKTYIATYASSASGGTCQVLITLGSAHALDTLSSLHDIIVKNAGPSNIIPLPTLLNRDDTTTIVSSPYAIYAHPTGVPFSTLYQKSSSSPDDNTQTRIKAELRLGAALKILHEHVQNDWFGIPGDEKEWGECYSWQEAFTLFLENALSEIEERERQRLGHSEGSDEETKIPISDIHRLLSRAIGFYLFDDVEVPSLVFNPSLDWASRIFVSAPSPFSNATSTLSTSYLIGPEDTAKVKEDEENKAATDQEGGGGGEITAFLGLENAIWGDPLLEGVFHPSLPSSALANKTDVNMDAQTSSSFSESEPSDLEWPSKPLLEGYTSNPMLLPRHRTKRLWYDLFVALRELIVVMYESKVDESGSGVEVEAEAVGKEERIRKRISQIVKKLEGAPCY